MSKCRPGAGVRFGLGGSLVLAALVLAGGAARAERPRVSVAPVAGEHATPELKEKLGQSLAEGLIASGAEIVPAPADATYLLRGRVEVEGRSYTLHLEMVDRRTGAVVASREDRCEICTEAEAFETANTAASTLKALVFKRGATPKGVATGATAAASSPAGGSSEVAWLPTAVAPPASPGSGGASVQLEATAAHPQAQHRRLGWAGVGGGLVSAGVGALLVSIDGSGTCGHDLPACPDQYQTRWGGIGLVALGVAVVAAGVLAIAGKL